MNAKQLPKLQMMTDALISRIAENRAFFVQMQITYKSGLVHTQGSVLLKDNALLWNNGIEETFVNLDDFSTLFCQDAKKYDAVTLLYKERGSTITLTADDKNVKTNYAETKAEAPIAGSPLLKEKEYTLTPSKAAPLLQALGIMTKEGKIKNDKIRKYNQIDQFLSIVAPLFADMETVEILDCGCGKSYLGFALNFFLRDILKKNYFITGVDINEGVITECRRLADTLSYHNMAFFCEDIASFSPNRKINTVVSLHACDTATDMALGLAVNIGASSIICVPCCHKELKDSLSFAPLDGLLRHGIYRARLNDTITDGLRTLQLEALGYKVSALEYISPIDTPKNLLIRAQKARPFSPKKQKELEDLCQLLNVRPSFTYKYIDFSKTAVE